jgi:hypothetical protein
MTQSDLNRELARVTGESLSTIRRRGFSIMEPLTPCEFDPEPNILPVQIIDWDEQERSRAA